MIHLAQLLPLDCKFVTILNANSDNVNQVLTLARRRPSLRINIHVLDERFCENLNYLIHTTDMRYAFITCDYKYDYNSEDYENKFVIFLS